jgi:hypothetical protein
MFRGNVARLHIIRSITEGPDEGEVVGFNVSGTVVDVFEKERKLESCLIKVDKEFIEGMEKIVWKAPGFRETGFRRPFDSGRSGGQFRLYSCRSS